MKTFLFDLGKRLLGLYRQSDSWVSGLWAGQRIVQSQAHTWLGHMMIVYLALRVSHWVGYTWIGGIVAVFYIVVREPLQRWVFHQYAEDLTTTERWADMVLDFGFSLFGAYVAMQSIPWDALL